MATGGHSSPMKDSRQQNPDASGSGFNDRLIQWSLLPNNLELNLRSKTTKKQRNKDKSRGCATAENFSPQQSSSSKFLDSCFQPLSPINHSTNVKRNIKVPVNQRPQPACFQVPSACSMDNENVASKEECTKKQPDAAIINERLAHLKDCIAQVNSVLQHLEQSSDEPQIIEQILTMKSIREDLLQKEAMIQNFANQASKDESKLLDMKQKLAQEERTQKLLLQQILQSSEDPDQCMRSVCVPKTPEGIKPNERNGVSRYYSDDDKANLQSHLLETMKASQEKFNALSHQKSLVLSMHHKKAEDKPSSLPVHPGENSPDSAHREQEWFRMAETTSGATAAAVVDKAAAINGDICWDKGANAEMPWHLENSDKSSKDNAWKDDSQDLTKLHVNLEHIKRRVELLQQMTDNGNVGVPCQPDVDDNLAERANIIEWQRKKLKNSLLELQEKKKASEEIMKELSLLREAANSIDILTDETSALAISPEKDQTCDERGRSIEDLRETINQLRVMMSNRSSMSASGKQDSEGAQGNFNHPISQPEAAPKQPLRSGPSTKRDNIKKEQSDQFPARRHYEAEGRANEEPDVPVPVPPAVSPLPEPTPWDNAARILHKQRELEKAKQKLQIMHALVNTIKDYKQVGQRIPPEYLKVFASLQEDEDADDNDTMTDNEESPENQDSDSEPGLIEGDISMSEIGATSIKDCANEPCVSTCRHSDKNRLDVENSEIEAAANPKAGEILLRLQEQFAQMQHKFSFPKQQNNEPMRSSGEGGSLQKKKTRSNPQLLPVGNELSSRRSKQGNLLTRQNVATVESQNQNNNSAVSIGRNTSLKKDNINDLSAKLVKPAYMCPQRSTLDSASNYNTDAASPFTTDLNQSLSLRDEIQQKSVLSVFDDLMKQDRSKPQNYSRNRDQHARSNSSINSEALDGSSSALAPDTTAAATWGGSSTQENFDDENGGNESMEDDDEDQGTFVKPVREVRMTSDMKPQTSHQYSGEQYGNISVDSSVKRRDNRLRKYFKSTQLNQWVEKKNLTKPIHSNQSTEASMEATCGDPMVDETVDQSDVTVPSARASVGHPMSSKFVHQLQQHLDKLNALCRPMLQEPHPLFSCPLQVPTIPTASHPSDGEGQPGFPHPMMHNPCRSYAMTDMMHNSMQQLQLQQQLLLSLGQYYQMQIYMQQLEIQHLHRCLQNPDSETANQTVQPSEDLVFRPWCLFPYLNVNPTVAVGPSQPSPMSAPPYLPPNPPAFPFNPSMGPSNVSTPYALVTGMQPARAVVHPAGQETRQNSETLNNQVPPRTRANNFWDNFRSYSRQNLLSTSNVVKSKDVAAGPQVRQVHPLVSNESSWGHRSRVFIPPHTENSSTTQSTDQTSVRPIGNPDFQESANRSKRPNSSKLPANQVIPDVAAAASNFNLQPKPDDPVRNVEGDVMNLELPQRITSSDVQRGVSCILDAKQKTSSTEPVPEAVHSEFSKLLCQNSHRPGYLELLRELRNLKSDSLQRALHAVRELMNNESASASAAMPENLENESGLGLYKEEPDRQSENDCTNTPVNDAIGSKLVSESVVQRSNTQNWAPATIIPLGNYSAPKPHSTGAIKKKPLRDTVLTMPSSSVTEPTVEKIDSLESMVENIVLESIPCIRNCSMDEFCTTVWSNFCACIIEALKTHMRVTAEFEIQLQQSLNQLISKYAGFKWFDCEADLLKNVARILYRELSLHRSMTFRASLEEVCEKHANSASKRIIKPDIVPSTTKAFPENRTVANKDSQDSSVPVKQPSLYPSSSSRDSENAVGELYINMPSEDQVLCPHYNGTIQQNSGRGSISSHISPPISNGPLQAVNAEEDMSYELEADAEPEVEACTEADLAEADQSPGQQGLAATAVWHAAQPLLTHGTAMGAEENFSQDSYNATESSGVASFSCLAAQSSSSSGEKEVALDDIPTKLMPLSQEELQRQMSEEQADNALLLEILEDVSLVGDGEALKEPQTFV